MSKNENGTDVAVITQLLLQLQAVLLQLLLQLLSSLLLLASSLTRLRPAAETEGEEQRRRNWFLAGSGILGAIPLKDQ